MKTTVFIFLTTFIFSSCLKNCPAEPKGFAFYFSITDEEMRDLFFGEDSVYDPHNVKFIRSQEIGEWSWVNVDIVNKAVGFGTEKCFWLGEFYPREKPYILLVELIPGKIDTIKIESRYMGSFRDGRCKYYRNEYDVFFNNIQFCSDCSEIEIYKIEIK